MRIITRFRAVVTADWSGLELRPVRTTTLILALLLMSIVMAMSDKSENAIEAKIKTAKYTWAETVYRSDGTSYTVMRKGWIAPDKWRIDGPDELGIMICNGNSRWDYCKSTNTYTFSKSANKLGYSVLMMLPDRILQTWGFVSRSSVKKTATGTLNGTTYNTVQVDIPASKECGRRTIVVYLDRTGLAKAYDAQQWSADGQMMSSSHVECEYGLDLDESLFVFKSPKGAVQVDKLP